MPTHATGMPSERALSAKAIGNRPLPASNPTGRERVGLVGKELRFAEDMIPLTLSGCLFVDSQVVFDLLQIAPHAGQAFKRHENAFLLALGRCRSAQHALIRRNIFRDAGLGANDRLFADMHVILDADLARDDDVVARAASSRQCPSG